MRVLHISPMPFGRGGLYGGGERYALELARHMAEVVPTRFISFADEGYVERIGKLDVHVLGRPWYVRGQRINPVHPKVIRHLGWATVAHCHQRFTTTSTSTAALCRLMQRKVFVTDHGGGGSDIAGRFPAIANWYTGHLHVSNYSRQVAGHAEYKRARVIYGGIDCEKFSPSATTSKESLVVYVGRILPHKGINDLIEALPPGLNLEIIGRPYHERFQADLRRLAEGKAIRFREDCTDAEIVQAYRRARAIVLPSVYRDMYGGETRVPELLGQTLLEGMACDAAGICTDVASMPEIITDGVNGFVVPPNNPAELKKRLEQIRDDAAEAIRLGKAARQTVLDRFAWPGVVRRCLEQYEGRTTGQ